MVAWKNLDTLESYKALQDTKGNVNLTEAMAGQNGADRVKKYAIPMAEGLTYHYAAKKVDDDILEKLASLAKEAQLSEKFQELYNGAVINLTENRRVLHQLTRGQLGGKVMADGVDKREFYKKEQEKIAAFAKKVHAGEITNEKGEKFHTVVQIGIGGSDLGPRAIYLALENWAIANDTLKMQARFISNVDPDEPGWMRRSICWQLPAKLPRWRTTADIWQPFSWMIILAAVTLPRLRLEMRFWRLRSDRIFLHVFWRAWLPRISSPRKRIL